MKFRVFAEFFIVLKKHLTILFFISFMLQPYLYFTELLRVSASIKCNLFRFTICLFAVFPESTILMYQKHPSG